MVFSNGNRIFIFNLGNSVAKPMQNRQDIQINEKIKVHQGRKKERKELTILTEMIFEVQCLCPYPQKADFPERKKGFDISGVYKFDNRAFTFMDRDVKQDGGRLRLAFFASFYEVD